MSPKSPARPLAPLVLPSLVSQPVQEELPPTYDGGLLPYLLCLGTQGVVGDAPHLPVLHARELGPLWGPGGRGAVESRGGVMGMECVSFWAYPRDPSDSINNPNDLSLACLHFLSPHDLSRQAISASHLQTRHLRLREVKYLARGYTGRAGPFHAQASLTPSQAS